MGYEKRLRTAGKRALRFVGKKFDEVIESLRENTPTPSKPKGSAIHVAGEPDPPTGPLATLTENDPVMKLLRRPEFNDILDRATMEKAVSLARQMAADAAEGEPRDLIPTNTPHGLFIDPVTAVQQLGFRERPSYVTYFLQELMVWRVPIAQTIVHTRSHQAGNMATPVIDKTQLGMKIRMANPEDHPTAADKKMIRFLTEAVYNSGTSHHGPMNMEALLKGAARDSLTHDQFNWQIIPDRLGRPAVWMPMDPKTIRLADTRKLHYDDDPETVRYVQVYDNVVIAEFLANELTFGVRNPRTDIRVAGYGTPEIEMLVTVVTALVNAFEYNANFFTNGTVAKGLLNIKGSIPDRQMKAFKRLWFAMVSGVANAWRSVVLNAEQVEWIPMHPNNRDMEFSSFFDFLVKLVCGMYLTDPIEVGHKYGTQQQRSMFEGGNRSKVQESRERGLRPLLRSFERQYNERIIRPWSDNFVFEFTGLDPMTAKEIADLDTMKLKTRMTFNELRASYDMESLGPDGDIPDNASFIAARTERINLEIAKEAQEQAQKDAAAAQNVPAVKPGVTGGTHAEGKSSKSKDLEGALGSLGGRPGPGEPGGEGKAPVFIGPKGGHWKDPMRQRHANGGGLGLAKSSDPTRASTIIDIKIKV